MPHVLFIMTGPVPPPKDGTLSRFHYFSEIGITGDVLLPVAWKTAADAERELPGLKFPEYRVGSFTYHLMLGYAYSSIKTAPKRFLFYIFRALKLHRNQPFDAVISYGTNLTGLSAWIISKLTGAKLICEISGVPQDLYRFDSPTRTLMTSVREFRADILLHFILRRTHGVHLLFPQQLDAYPKLASVPRYIFHGFVPVSRIQPGTVDDKYILFMGFPWFLKGVDILIKAFQRVADRIPEHRLRIVGYVADRRPLEELAAGHPRISLEKPVHQPEAYELIRNCSVFVLPSRTEAMGRVLLEAMAAKKPVIGSRVAGIPHYIRDGENGLTFTSESVEELGEAMVKILTNPALAARFGDAGLKLVLSQLSEKRYAEEFRKMIVAVTGAK